MIWVIVGAMAFGALVLLLCIDGLEAYLKRDI